MEEYENARIRSGSGFGKRIAGILKRVMVDAICSGVMEGGW